MAFHDHTENGITVLQSDLLCGSIRHGFSTRTGGVSPAPWDSLNLGVGRGDDLANVQENFRRLCGVLGLSHQRAVLSKQVHEDNIRLVTEADCGKGLFRQRDYTSVDAMICFETDDDVPEAMRRALGAAAEPYMVRRGEKWHIDLKGINALWLRQAGVQRIDVCPDCTGCHPERWWSHRKMGDRRGAQAALIALI